MEDFFATVITQLPNLAVAIWMLSQQNRTIANLLDAQTRLVDRLLDRTEAKIAGHAPIHP